MDPIDQIASRFTYYCQQSLHAYLIILDHLNRAQTIQEGLKALSREGLLMYVDQEAPEKIAALVEGFRRCLESMEDIRNLAKKVFIFNFYESDPAVVFKKEVSFSYACKMLSRFGPLNYHFSNTPNNTEIIRAELSLAWTTPSTVMNSDRDLLCLECMPPRFPEEALDLSDSQDEDFDRIGSPERFADSCILQIS